MNDMILEIRHLSKSFGSHEVLRDIDFSVAKGDVTSIIGASGSGKSTLLRCINLLETPTSGEILYHGRNVASRGVNAAQYRSHVGMVFQSFNLFNNMTVLENCMVGQVKVLKKNKSDARDNTMRYLTQVGMAPYINAKPRQISGGQKQRVAIARALATDPKVLLCDEATSALDPTTTASILGLLKDLNQKLGVTVVVITHQMSVIEEICGRVAIISESRIVESGAVSDVFRHPKTSAARQLIIPGSEAARNFTGTGKVYRITFDGTTSDQPVVAGMVLACGEPVNIWFADTRDIDGKAYGHMLVQLPESEVTAGRMLSYLDEIGVTYEEESQHAQC
mgnify:CR=1 FL=1